MISMISSFNKASFSLTFCFTDLSTTEASPLPPDGIQSIQVAKDLHLDYKPEGGKYLYNLTSNDKVQVGD